MGRLKEGLKAAFGRGAGPARQRGRTNTLHGVFRFLPICLGQPPCPVSAPEDWLPKQHTRLPLPPGPALMSSPAQPCTADSGKSHELCLNRWFQRLARLHPFLGPFIQAATKQLWSWDGAVAAFLFSGISWRGEAASGEDRGAQSNRGRKAPPRCPLQTASHYPKRGHSCV